MRIFFSVGEPSGDLHGSNLIRRLKSQDPGIECVGFGGPKMAAAGCQLHFELTTLAVMFIGKVIANLRTFFRLIDEANDYLRDNHVDAVVLINYPGFNWWIARKAKKHGVPVFYYGVPQVWAWAPWRVRKIRRLVDHVLCKLPFEADWFAKRGCPATYVGHPYFDQLATQQYDQQFLDDLNQSASNLLTLLPGSRAQEVEHNLPILLNAASLVEESIPGIRVAIACFNEAQQEMARKQLVDHDVSADLFTKRTPELMRAATVCLACSGSVSMELLYHRKPTVIVYKVSKLAILVQAFLLRTKFITLVNLIAAQDIRRSSWWPYDPDQPNGEIAVMPEYMTAGDPSQKIAAQAIGWLTDGELRNQKIAELDELAAHIAKPGATRLAADFILQRLRHTVVADQSAAVAVRNIGRVSHQQGAA